MNNKAFIDCLRAIQKRFPQPKVKMTNTFRKEKQVYIYNVQKILDMKEYLEGLSY